MIKKQTTWVAGKNLLLTELSGHVSLDDVRDWESSLYFEIQKIRDNGEFKFMANLHRFKASDIQAHKAFREIIPRTLAKFGWRVGYLDLFPEADVILKNERGIRCKAAAHVHHDETKIQLYEANYSRPNEHFFTDPVKAKEWIDSFAD